MAPSPDPWTLDSSAPDWLEAVCTRLLEVGVPPSALAKAFFVDVAAIKDLQADLHVEKFGTAEISEAMSFLMWHAYQDALEILESAPSATRRQFITTLLSRQSVILGKQSPEELGRMRDQLSDLFAGIGVPDPQAGSIYATSPFTPVDRVADDPEEGPQG
jgi:hypothetical protein